MVYGRILYNSIKEYTPKWFPTIPYSQTTKPVFGNFHSSQEDNHKLYQSGTQRSKPRKDGVCLATFSNTVGPIKSLCSVSASESGQLFTSPFWPFINQITNTVLIKLPWLKKKPSRKPKKRSNWRSKLHLERANDTKQIITLLSNLI